METLWYSAFFLSTLLLGVCDGARILGVYVTPSPSHRNILQSLFEELADRGHEVTVISPFPREDARPNYRDIPLNMSSVHPFSKRNPFEISEMFPPKMFLFMWMALPKTLTTALESPALQEFLKDDSEHFDLVIIQYFFNDALVGFGHKYKAPVIGVFTSEGNEVIGDAVGDPFPYAYIPNALLDYSNHMTFCERLYSTLINVFFKLGRNLYYLNKQQAVMRKYLNMGDDSPTIEELYYNTSLLLMNGHIAYSYPRPHVPNYIDVGGIHIKPPKKLPKDLQTFLDNSPEGVIYFSMGSNLKSSQMSTANKEAFIKVFSELKQNVLWKFEDDSLKTLPKNVKIEKWLPQSDLLAHPNVRLFMTHGGLLSTQEAIYHGKPLIGIPIFADQKLNIKSAMRGGYCVLLEYKNVSEDSVRWALNEIINNPQYSANAKRISEIFHDQPQTSMEKAMFWIEYVIRHKGAPHMRSAALDLTWYQYYLLDVIIVLSLGACVILAVPVLLIRKLFCSSKSKPQVKQSKKKN